MGVLCYCYCLVRFNIPKRTHVYLRSPCVLFLTLHKHETVTSATCHTIPSHVPEEHVESIRLTIFTELCYRLPLHFMKQCNRSGSFSSLCVSFEISAEQPWQLSRKHCECCLCIVQNIRGKCELRYSWQPLGLLWLKQSPLFPK